MSLVFSKRRGRGLWLVAAALALLLRPGSSRATLGGAVDSIESDRMALSAVRRSVTSSQQGYSIHQLEAGGTAIREYVNSSGVVFGIAWNGLTHPNLQPLLGAYEADYQAAERSQPLVRGRRSRLVQGSQVVVAKWGHMRNLQGRAYLPALLPTGVSPDAIR